MANVSTVYIPTIFGRTSFPLQHQGYSIFYKEFSGNNSNVVDADNDKITIQNHFFKTGEPLKYKIPIGGVRIGINSTSPGASGISSFPDIVYPIVVDQNNIRVALASSLALQNKYVSITSVGEGDIHSFEVYKQNSKCLISIDNIIQSPLSVGSTATVNSIDILNPSKITLSSLKNIKLGTILKINGELSNILTIDYNDNSVTLYRGSNSVPYLGSTPANIGLGNTAYVMEGNYNIVKDKIYFTESPLEGIAYVATILPNDINYSIVGISSYSFNCFTNNFVTGSQVKLSGETPPQGLSSDQNYFLIKNTENNFSFASSYVNSINKVKIGITSTGNEKFIQLKQILPRENSSFGGRVFLKSNYDNNAVFDDISEQFNGISSSFVLKNSGINTVGIKSDNGILLVNNIFQYPEFEECFQYQEDIISGITSVTFNGSVGAYESGIGTTKDYDVNVKGLPRGGIIVGYGLSGGINYQPPVQAEAYVYRPRPEGGVGVENIEITNPGSGYRPGISTYYVTFESSSGIRTTGLAAATVSNGSVTEINFIEEASYDLGTKAPSIVIDSPISYENVPLSGSTLGIGASVSFDINSLGQVSNFRFTNPGYGYTVGEVLTVAGILTAYSYTNSNKLTISINEVGKDTFSAWDVGILQKLDDLSPLVNGFRKTFTIKETIDGESNPISLETEPGSPIELSYNLLVFVNDVLQIPGSSYTFNRGTQIRFKEAPPVKSNVKVYFYRGSTGDSEQVDIDPPIEIGDNLLIQKDFYNSSPTTQVTRTVKKILTSDTLQTEFYNKNGLSNDSSQFRSVTFTPKKRDLIISGELISKSRQINKSNVGIFTGIGVTTATFTQSSTNVAINTSIGVGINTGDYIESTYLQPGVYVISIGSGVIGISTIPTSLTGTNSTTVSIWRKL